MMLVATLHEDTVAGLRSCVGHKEIPDSLPTDDFVKEVDELWHRTMKLARLAGQFEGRFRSMTVTWE